MPSLDCLCYGNCIFMHKKQKQAAQYVIIFVVVYWASTLSIYKQQCVMLCNMISIPNVEGLFAPSKICTTVKFLTTVFPTIEGSSQLLGGGGKGIPSPTPPLWLRPWLIYINIYRWQYYIYNHQNTGSYVWFLLMFGDIIKDITSFPFQ